MKKPTPYDLLLDKSKKIYTLQSVLVLLEWDKETYMPSGGITPRSDQIALVSSMIHELKTNASYKALLGKLVHFTSGKIKATYLNKHQKLIVREWLKAYERDKKLPNPFVKEFAHLTSEAAQVWAMAKKDNNYKLFLPFLERIIGLNKKKAEYFGYDDHPYDALLQYYEPCMSSNRVSRIFDGLQKELKGLLKKIVKAPQIDTSFLTKPVSDEKQKELGEWINSITPVEPGYTRLDTTSHPFSMAIHPRDSRITTRYVPDLFMSNLFSVLHEAGHSMYEMGLPMDSWGTPLCEAVSLTVHESQSRWWETLIGRSLPFWKKYYPELQKRLPALKSVSLKTFYRAINCVTPSFIRVEADEVTYCLHVILRFQIERDLVSGKLAPVDLPDAWNTKFKEIFGKTPPSNAKGCLQDIHWSIGAFGYFPTYALGNLLAAQFFTAFAKKHPDYEALIEQGDLTFIRDWLKKNIHHHGKTYDLDELCKKVTGKPFSEEAYCSYLKKKYADIYQL